MTKAEKNKVYFFYQNSRKNSRPKNTNLTKFRCIFLSYSTSTVKASFPSPTNGVADILYQGPWGEIKKLCDIFNCIYLFIYFPRYLYVCRY